MGQTYSVQAKLMFDNEERDCDFAIAASRMLSDRLKRSVIAMDAWSAFRLLTGGDQIEREAIWFADFDGTYSWENLMYDAFKEALPYCKDGSYVRVWPDSGRWELRKENGKVRSK